MRSPAATISGKSRLALQVAAEVAPVFRAGVPAMARSHEARRAVHGRTEVVAVAFVDLAGVDAYPHKDGVEIRDRGLALFGRGHCIPARPNAAAKPSPPVANTYPSLCSIAARNRPSC